MLDQGGEQRVPRLGGVFQAEGLGRQEIGQVEADGRRRQGGQPVGIGHERFPLGNVGRALGIPLGPDGQHGRDQSDDEHRGQAAGQSARPPTGAHLATESVAGVGQFGVGPPLGGGEEPLLHGREVFLGVPGPVQGRSQAGPAVQLVVRLPLSLPLARRGHEMPAHGPAGRVVLEPAGQAGPRGQQRLVHHVEHLAVHGQKSPGDERVDHRPAGRVVEIQFGKGQRPPYERPAVVGVGQPHEQPAGRLAARLVESRVGGLGRAGEGPCDTAGLPVASEGEPVAASAFPRADQCGGEQRQRGRPARHIGHHGVEQFGLTGEADRRGRAVHDLAQLVIGHRWDEHQRGAEPFGESSVLRQPPDVIAAHHRDASGDVAGVEQSQHGVEEGGPLSRLDSRRPELLELVADQHDRRIRARTTSGERVQGRDRSTSRREDDDVPGLATG